MNDDIIINDLKSSNFNSITFIKEDFISLIKSKNIEKIKKYLKTNFLNKNFSSNVKTSFLKFVFDVLNENKELKTDFFDLIKGKTDFLEIINNENICFPNIHYTKDDLFFYINDNILSMVKQSINISENKMNDIELNKKFVHNFYKTFEMIFYDEIENNIEQEKIEEILNNLFNQTYSKKYPIKNLSVFLEYYNHLFYKNLKKNYPSIDKFVFKNSKEIKLPKELLFDIYTDEKINSKPISSSLKNNLNKIFQDNELIYNYSKEELDKMLNNLINSFLFENFQIILEKNIIKYPELQEKYLNKFLNSVDFNLFLNEKILEQLNKYPELEKKFLNKFLDIVDLHSIKNNFNEKILEQLNKYPELEKKFLNKVLDITNFDLIFNIKILDIIEKYPELQKKFLNTVLTVDNFYNYSLKMFIYNTTYSYFFNHISKDKELEKTVFNNLSEYIKKTIKQNKKDNLHNNVIIKLLLKQYILNIDEKKLMKKYNLDKDTFIYFLFLKKYNIDYDFLYNGKLDVFSNNEIFYSQIIEYIKSNITNKLEDNKKLIDNIKKEIFNPYLLKFYNGDDILNNEQYFNNIIIEKKIINNNKKLRKKENKILSLKQTNKINKKLINFFILILKSKKIKDSLNNLTDLNIFFKKNNIKTFENFENFVTNNNINNFESSLLELKECFSMTFIDKEMDYYGINKKNFKDIFSLVLKSDNKKIQKILNYKIIDNFNDHNYKELLNYFNSLIFKEKINYLKNVNNNDKIIKYYFSKENNISINKKIKLINLMFKKDCFKKNFYEDSSLLKTFFDNFTNISEQLIISNELNKDLKLKLFNYFFKNINEYDNSAIYFINNNFIKDEIFFKENNINSTEKQKIFLSIEQIFKKNNTSFEQKKDLILSLNNYFGSHLLLSYFNDNNVSEQKKIKLFNLVKDKPIYSDILNKEIVLEINKIKEIIKKESFNYEDLKLLLKTKIEKLEKNDIIDIITKIFNILKKQNLKISHQEVSFLQNIVLFNNNVSEETKFNVLKKLYYLNENSLFSINDIILLINNKNNSLSKEFKRKLLFMIIFDYTKISKNNENIYVEDCNNLIKDMTKIQDLRLIGVSDKYSDLITFDELKYLIGLLKLTLTNFIITQEEIIKFEKLDFFNCNLNNKNELEIYFKDKLIFSIKSLEIDKTSSIKMEKLEKFNKEDNLIFDNNFVLIDNNLKITSEKNKKVNLLNLNAEPIKLIDNEQSNRYIPSNRYIILQNNYPINELNNYLEKATVEELNNLNSSYFNFNNDNCSSIDELNKLLDFLNKNKDEIPDKIFNSVFLNLSNLEYNSYNSKNINFNDFDFKNLIDFYLLVSDETIYCYHKDISKNYFNKVFDLLLEKDYKTELLLKKISSYFDFDFKSFVENLINKKAVKSLEKIFITYRNDFKQIIKKSKILNVSLNNKTEIVIKEKQEKELIIKELLNIKAKDFKSYSYIKSLNKEDLKILVNILLNDKEKIAFLETHYDNYIKAKKDYFNFPNDKLKENEIEIHKTKLDNTVNRIFGNINIKTLLFLSNYNDEDNKINQYLNYIDKKHNLNLIKIQSKNNQSIFKKYKNQINSLKEIFQSKSKEDKIKLIDKLLLDVDLNSNEKDYLKKSLLFGKDIKNNIFEKLFTIDFYLTKFDMKTMNNNKKTTNNYLKYLTIYWKQKKYSEDYIENKLKDFTNQAIGFELYYNFNDYNKFISLIKKENLDLSVFHNYNLDNIYKIDFNDTYILFKKIFKDKELLNNLKGDFNNDINVIFNNFSKLNQIIKNWKNLTITEIINILYTLNFQLDNKRMQNTYINGVKASAKEKAKGKIPPLGEKEVSKLDKLNIKVEEFQELEKNGEFKHKILPYKSLKINKEGNFVLNEYLTGSDERIYMNGYCVGCCMTVDSVAGDWFPAIQKKPNKIGMFMMTEFHNLSSENKKELNSLISEYNKLLLNNNNTFKIKEEIKDFAIKYGTIKMASGSYNIKGQYTFDNVETLQKTFKNNVRVNNLGENDIIDELKIFSKTLILKSEIEMLEILKYSTNKIFDLIDYINNKGIVFTTMGLGYSDIDIKKFKRINKYNFNFHSLNDCYSDAITNSGNIQMVEISKNHLMNEDFNIYNFINDFIEKNEKLNVEDLNMKIKKLNDEYLKYFYIIDNKKIDNNKLKVSEINNNNNSNNNSINNNNNNNLKNV